MSCDEGTFVSDLSSCDYGLCDWQWHWKIYTPLEAGKTYFFEGGNASISISQPVMRLSTCETELILLRLLLLFADPFAPSLDSSQYLICDYLQSGHIPN